MEIWNGNQFRVRFARPVLWFFFDFTGWFHIKQCQLPDAFVLTHSTAPSLCIPTSCKTSYSSSGANEPAKSATRKMRFLRCATPQYCASRQRHASENSLSNTISPASGQGWGYGPGIRSPGKQTRMISSNTIRKSSYFGVPLEKAPGTFSQHRNLGRTKIPDRPRSISAFLISFVMRICSMNKPERAPAKPARAPATDKSWQGLPPQMISTGGSSAPFNLVISPTWIMSGKRSFVTSMGKVSISLAHTGLTPQCTAAKGKPPMPSKRLPIVISWLKRRSAWLLRICPQSSGLLF